MLTDPRERAALLRPLEPGECARQTPQLHDSEEPMLAALRRWRRRALVRIAWRALAGWADLEQTLEESSQFADAAITVAVEYARRELTRRFGAPRGPDGSV
ncbi:Glutamate-ammonia ligase adenylyltransferase domain protein, partial [mine drainage metagenome]